MPKSYPTIQKRYKEKMIAAGYKRVTVWIPESAHAEFTDIVEEMREEYEEECAAKKARASA